MKLLADNPKPEPPPPEVKSGETEIYSSEKASVVQKGLRRKKICGNFVAFNMSLQDPGE